MFWTFIFQIEYDDRAKQESLKQQQPVVAPKPATTATAAAKEDSDEDDFDIDAI